MAFPSLSTYSYFFSSNLIYSNPSPATTRPVRPPCSKPAAGSGSTVKNPRREHADWDCLENPPTSTFIQSIRRKAKEFCNFSCPRYLCHLHSHLLTYYVQIGHLLYITNCPVAFIEFIASFCPICRGLSFLFAPEIYLSARSVISEHLMRKSLHDVSSSPRQLRK